jgi:hypothetical protein
MFEKREPNRETAPEQAQPELETGVAQDDESDDAPGFFTAYCSYCHNFYRYAPGGRVNCHLCGFQLGGN